MAGLNADATEEDHRDGALLDLVIETVKRALRGFAGQILAGLDLEAVTLQLFGDIACVIDRLLQRRVGGGVFGVADDQREPVAVDPADSRMRQRRRHQQQRETGTENNADKHATPIPNVMRFASPGL